MIDQPTLCTRRLLLRPLGAGDAEAVRVLAGAREIADTTLTIPHPYPDGAADEWITGQRPAWLAGAAATYAITDAADGALVGCIGLAIAPEHRSAELGYWVGVPWWNRGYCTEAGRAILDLAFGELELHRVEARHFTRNEASGRVMQKLGMRFEGIQREALRRWDRFEDVAVYAILEHEWPGSDEVLGV